MFTFSEEETKKPVAADAAPVVANGKKDDSSDDDSSEGLYYGLHKVVILLWFTYICFFTNFLFTYLSIFFR